MFRKPNLELGILKFIRDNGRMLRPPSSNEIKIKNYTQEQIGNMTHSLFLCDYFKGKSLTNHSSKYPSYLFEGLTRLGRERITSLENRFWKQYNIVFGCLLLQYFFHSSIF